ncbi:alpha-2,3-sialyltransferase [Campylobacter coli]
MPKNNAVVVAGNGASLKEIDYSRLPKEFDVFRCNQFYFEDKYYLGRKVKAAFSFPGVFFEQYYTLNTLMQNKEYYCENIVCKLFPLQHEINQKSLRNFKKIFPLFFPYALDGNEHYFNKLKELNSFINFNFLYDEGLQITTGMYAIACAVACGYKEIYITGIDFYSTQDYAFDIKDKIGLYTLNPSFKIQYLKSHNKETDLEILSFLKQTYNANFFSISPKSPITKYIPLAPKQNYSFDIEEKSSESIKDFLIPSKKAYQNYSRALYLQNNMFYNFIHDCLKFPSALKNYFKNTKKGKIK